MSCYGTGIGEGSGHPGGDVKVSPAHPRWDGHVSHAHIYDPDRADLRAAGEAQAQHAPIDQQPGAIRAVSPGRLQLDSATDLWAGREINLQDKRKAGRSDRHSGICARPTATRRLNAGSLCK